MSETISVIVIGAGVAGLSCSINLVRTAKRIGKRVDVTVFEKRSGTWATSTVYPGLITNNSWRAMLIEDQEGEMAKLFTDKTNEYGAGPGLFRATGPAMTVHMDQIEAKARRLGIKFHFETNVTSVEKRPIGGWKVTYVLPDGTHTADYDKLVCASGSFSSPAVPPCAHKLWKEELPEKLSLPVVLHSQQLSVSQVQPVVEDAKEFIVVGASKSAMDSAERFGLMGRKVTLVVKNAPYLAPPSFHDKQGKPADAQAGVSSRIFTGFIPYYRDPISGLVSSGGFISSLFRSFLHTTWLGGFLQRFFERKITSIFAEFNQWSASPANGAMRPDTPMTWMEASTYPGPEQLPSLIKEGRVIPLRGATVDIKRSGQQIEMDVQLNDGTLSSIKGDVVIFCTGWRTGELPFFSRALSDELGMPHKYLRLQDRPEREALFEEIDVKSLDKLLASQRTLRNLPVEWSSPTYGARIAGQDPTAQVAPIRLYRLMVPLSHLNSRDIVFPGVSTNKANTVLADAQGHWIADYLLDNLPRPLPSFSKAAEEISMHVVWSRRLFGPAQGRIASWVGTTWFENAGRLCWDMCVSADSEGLTGVVDSNSFKLEEKRVKRDEKRFKQRVEGQKLANRHID